MAIKDATSLKQTDGIADCPFINLSLVEIVGSVTGVRNASHRGSGTGAPVGVARQRI
jgi:hypothetical protein